MKGYRKLYIKPNPGVEMARRKQARERRKKEIEEFMAKWEESKKNDTVARAGPDVTAPPPAEEATQP